MLGIDLSGTLACSGHWSYLESDYANIQFPKLTIKDAIKLITTNLVIMKGQLLSPQRKVTLLRVQKKQDTFSIFLEV